MLYQVEVRTAQGSLLTLLLEDVSDGYAVEEIGGLDPVKATIVSTDFAQIDGTIYQSSRRESRNLTFKIELRPDYTTQTMRSLRTALYNFFMPKTEIELRYYDDVEDVVSISGRVESCTAPQFGKDNEVNISIICFDPDFIELDAVDLTGSTVADSTETLVEYKGTTETGIKLVMNVNRTMSGFTIYNRIPGNNLQTLDFAGSLVSGDVLTINTVPFSKGATLTRAGVNSSLLYGVSPQANWTLLKNGDNYIRVHATGAAVPFDLSYYNRYGGL